MSEKRSDGSFSIGSDVWPGVSKLIEEMGELQQVLGKLIALHGDTDHWDGTDLRERLVEEMGDVEGALHLVRDLCLTHEEGLSVTERAVAKFHTFIGWQAEQS